MSKSILFVINNFNIGGPQKSLLSLLYKLDYNKYNIDLMVLSNDGSLIKHLPEKVNLVTTDLKINYAILSPNNFFKKTLHMLFLNPKIVLKAIPRILLGQKNKNMVQEKQKYWLAIKNSLPKIGKKYDVAIGVSGGSSMMCIEDCVSATKKVSWIRSDYRVLKRNHKIDAKYFARMNEIISVSQLCKDIFVDIFPEAISKVQVMYNVLPFEMYKKIPVDTSKLEKVDDYFKILTVCRLDPNKGLDLAIGTVEILKRKNIKFRWYVLGGGSYKAELEELIKAKGLEDYFILLGFEFNTAEFIKNADILVHPSRFEGKSNVVDEAKYLLKPIVVTNYETVKEQISHEKNGLISEMNSQSIAEAIIRIMNQPNLSHKFHEVLYNERFKDQKSLQTFINIIESS